MLLCGSIEMEILDVVNEYGEPTGQVVDRQLAHSEGYRHRTSHVWLIRKNEHTFEVFLQKRSEDKDSYPGCLDISSAGHIPAGVDFKESALRELKEELGITAAEEELILCGQCYDRRENLFYGSKFIDDQVSNIYVLYWRDDMEITLQEEEIQDCVWMDFQECMEKVGDNSIKHCIRLNELEMVRQCIVEKKIENYPPGDRCGECKGHCCKSLGCSLSPADLLRRLDRSTLDYDILLEIIKSNDYAIDRFAGRYGYTYFLRMRHKCFTFIGVDAYGECIALGENGCMLSEEDRPKGGRTLEPVAAGPCVQHYGREEMEKDWRPYRRLLSEIWEKYETMFEQDGTFDRCEQEYMELQKSRHRG